MSAIFDRFTKSKSQRQAEAVLSLLDRAADQLGTARPVVQEEFSPDLADLVGHTATSLAELYESARQELNALSQGAR
jgi:MoxR-like ATPase